MPLKIGNIDELVLFVLVDCILIKLVFPLCLPLTFLSHFPGYEPEITYALIPSVGYIEQTYAQFTKRRKR